MVSAAQKAYLAICRELAAELADDGVTFDPTGPYLRSEGGQWRCQMTCQTSHYNRVDHVDLTLYYDIEGDRLARYRATTAPIDIRPGSGVIAGGMLGGDQFPDSRRFPRGLGRPSQTGAAGPAVAALADYVRRGPLAVLRDVGSPATALDTVPETLIFGTPHQWIDYLGAFNRTDLIAPLLERLLAGGHLTWTGPIFDRRNLLLDSQRQLQGLPGCTSHAPSAVDAFVAAIQRANETDTLLNLSL